MTLTPPGTKGLRRAVVRKSPPVSQTNAAVFRVGCVLVWGHHFISPAAKRLRVNERTVQRWAKAEYPIPGGIFMELRDALDEHIDNLREFRHTLSSRIERLVEDD